LRQVLFLPLKHVKMIHYDDFNRILEEGRRTFATKLLNNGANIKELQILMGHSSINTTAIYVQEDPERLANIVIKLR